MRKMKKEEVLHLAKQFEEEGELEILEKTKDYLLVFDGEKESVIRFSETLDKVSLLEEIVEVLPQDIDKEKLIRLLSTLDDSLFLSVQKILFFEGQEQYDDIMSQYFENMDMLDVDEELGKYLYFEDWVLINMGLIKACADDLALTENQYIEELNIGLWTTLLHELRHGYQFTYLFQATQSDVDIEEDAEDYGIQLFEQYIESLDYVVTH